MSTVLSKADATKRTEVKRTPDPHGTHAAAHRIRAQHPTGTICYCDHKRHAKGESKQTMHKTRELIGVVETADRLGVSPRTVYRYLNDRKLTIPYQKIGGRVVMFREDLDNFITENEGNNLIKAVRNKRKG